MQEENIGQQFEHIWSPEYGRRVPKLYHGSGEEFKPGDMISHKSRFRPGRMAGVDSETERSFHESGYATSTHKEMPFVFASDETEYAKEYAHTKRQHQYDTPAPGHIYEVEAVNPKSLVHLMPGEIGSPDGFRVVRKITNG